MVTYIFWPKWEWQRKNTGKVSMLQTNMHTRNWGISLEHIKLWEKTNAWLYSRTTHSHDLSAKREVYDIILSLLCISKSNTNALSIHKTNIPKKCCAISASIFFSVVSVASKTTAFFSCCSLAVLVAGSRLGGDVVLGRFLVSGCESFWACKELLVIGG